MTSDTTSDTLLLPDWIIPVEPAHTVLAAHGLAIRGGRILEIAPHADLQARYPQARVRHLPGRVLLPGFVNLHGHAAMSLLRGYGDDLPLMEWLSERIWPAERRLISPDFVYDGSVLAFTEMLAGGTTCCNDMYFHPSDVARAALTVGMRAAVGGVLFDVPGGPSPDSLLEAFLATRDEYRDEPLLRFTLAPHAPYTVGDDLFRRIGMLAEEIDVPITVHLQETAQEVQDSLAQHGMRPTERLDGLGLISPRLIAVHGVHLDAGDISLLAAQGAHLAHCPASNLKLASGIAPVSQMLAAGLNVGIGTDGAASNNRLDMLSEMRLAALLAKGATGDARALAAHDALHAATLAGAKALGWDAEIGSLVPGKYADIVAIQLDAAHLQPVYDPASHVVYAAGREDVDEVWVNGETVAKKLQLTNSPSKSDHERIMSRLSQWHERAAGVLSGTNAYPSLG
jgi:5-methylthioadenosine/S-adenosylhomocysteine deaminase